LRRVEKFWVLGDAKSPSRYAGSVAKARQLSLFTRLGSNAALGSLFPSVEPPRDVAFPDEILRKPNGATSGLTITRRRNAILRRRLLRRLFRRRAIRPSSSLVLTNDTTFFYAVDIFIV
jgi:hypothetical protein